VQGERSGESREDRREAVEEEVDEGREGKWS